MRQPSLQPRQNSHPNLVHQTSYSSSTSSLADRSSLESHGFQQYKVSSEGGYFLKILLANERPPILVSDETKSRDAFASKNLENSLQSIV